MTVFDLQRQPQVEQQQLTQTPAPSQPQRVSAQQYRQMVGLPQQTERNVKTQSSAAHCAQPDDRITFRDHDPQTAKWEREHPLILLEEPKFTPTKKGRILFRRRKSVKHRCKLRQRRIKTDQNKKYRNKISAPSQSNRNQSSRSGK